MKWNLLCAAALSAAICVTPAFAALEYSIDAPDNYLFGRPTSDNTIYDDESENVDRGKNAALIPPGFGSPTSYLPGTGEPLTPNLVPGALDGGLVPSTGGGVTYPGATGNDGSSWRESAFTDLSWDLYYSAGHIGTLKIPAIGLTVKVYQGTDSAALRKGAGHFEDTSVWEGNVCLAGHNRGVNNHFGKIHTLEEGDTITYITRLGTRTYEVVDVRKIRETDTSDTRSTWDNRITLYTCVRDQSEYRWCVQAVEK